MKIAILGDTHFGARNTNTLIQDWQQKFYEECFWPYIEEKGIKTIIQTGDYFDNRKWINLQTMAFQKEVFVKKAQQLKCNVHVIIGNHDTPLRHSLKNSSVEQLLKQEDYFSVYSELETLEFEDRKITFCPWICRENEEEILEEIRKGGDILIGHFEITGFVMHPGAVSKDGLTTQDFNGWNKVWSGHYHTQSEKNNIHYIGTPYQLTWNDYSTRHGFWIYDTTDDTMEFIRNPFSYFHKIIWEDGSNFDVTKVKNSYVKLEVKKKTDFETFEKFLDKINYNEPYNIKIMETFEEFSSENVDDIIQLSSTSDLIKEYISDVATVNNKENIINTMLDIYNEALEVNDSF